MLGTASQLYFLLSVTSYPTPFYVIMVCAKVNLFVTCVQTSNEVCYLLFINSARVFYRFSDILIGKAEFVLDTEHTRILTSIWDLGFYSICCFRLVCFTRRTISYWTSMWVESFAPLQIQISWDITSNQHLANVNYPLSETKASLHYANCNRCLLDYFIYLFLWILILIKDLISLLFHILYKT